MEKEKVLPYLQNLCAKREYCRSEILKKAETALEGDRQAAQEMLDSLVADRFVDDARYAAAFARERSSLTGWGPEKIRYSLMMKGISKADIAAALEEVDQDAAAAKLLKLLTAKRNTLLGDPYIKFKLIKYALSRGYRYDDVGPAVENILSEND
ncbi:MAG: RecX family transcriptional regulator [Bacteroidales bacterium]|nr:RecX family transcriptional regulator [Bacteroidales bacterium]MBR5071991.1 RecX family transcriptional regulator [Bacteroidales bacterium]